MYITQSFHDHTVQKKKYNTLGMMRPSRNTAGDMNVKVCRGREGEEVESKEEERTLGEKSIAKKQHGTAKRSRRLKKGHWDVNIPRCIWYLARKNKCRWGR